MGSFATSKFARTSKKATFDAREVEIAINPTLPGVGENPCFFSSKAFYYVCF